MIVCRPKKLVKVPKGNRGNYTDYSENFMKPILMYHFINT